MAQDKKPSLLTRLKTEMVQHEKCDDACQLFDVLKDAADEIERLTDLLTLMDDAFLSRHGCFPLDRTNSAQRLWNDAMHKCREVTGEDWPARAMRSRRALRRSEVEIL